MFSLSLAFALLILSRQSEMFGFFKCCNDNRDIAKTFHKPWSFLNLQYWSICDILYQDSFWKLPLYVLFFIRYYFTDKLVYIKERLICLQGLNENITCILNQETKQVIYPFMILINVIISGIAINRKWKMQMHSKMVSSCGK